VTDVTRYDSYRTSSTELLPDPPAHWSDQPIWTLFTRAARKGHGDETLLSVYRDHGVVPKASRSDNFNRASEDLSTYQLVSPGDLVVNKMKAWQGSVSISAHRGIVSPAYFVYEAHHEHDSRYLHHLLRSAPLIAAYRTISSGVRIGQWDLDPWAFSRIRLPMPPLPEQEQIADYLDRETAQIDRLIAKQEQLVTRLHERRESQIAATLQEHAWLERRIKDVASVVNGYPFDAATFMDAGGTPLVRIRDIVSTEYATFVPQEAVPSEAIICDGDIVIGMDGDFNSVLWSRGPAALNQRLCLLRTGTDALASYLAYAVLRPLKLINDLTYSTTVKHLSSKQVANIRIPLPPLDEQRRIVAHLDEQTAKIDTLIAKAQRFIELAKERRAALITAAVTGQLDVTAA